MNQARQADHPRRIGTAPRRPVPSMAAVAEKEKKKPVIHKKTETNPQEKEPKNRKPLWIGLAVVVVLVAGVIGYGCYGVYGKDTVMKGVTFMETDLSGMSQQQVAETVNGLSDKIKDYELTLYMGETTRTQKFSDLDATLDGERVAEEAVNTGRNGNVFSNLATFYRGQFSSLQVPLKIRYDSVKMNDLIIDFVEELQNPMKPNDYEIDYEKAILYITEGEDGTIIDKEKVLADINQAVEEIGDQTSVKVEVVAQEDKCPEITPELVKKEVECEPQDAKLVTDENGHKTVEKEIIGVKVAEADVQAGLDAGKDDKGSYQVKVTLEQPDVDYFDLAAELFNDTLASCTTQFNSGLKGRTTNVKLAAQKINGVILNPGEVFSFNNTVGKRTAEAGFENATIYTSNGMEDGLGGGICQVSSTLYNATLYADLETVERRNHKYKVTYVKLGTDATVAWGSIDFRFKNSRNYPVKIEATVSGNSLTVAIKGTKEDDRQVTITTSAYNTVAAGEQITYDSSMADGKRVVTSNGMTGVTVDTFKKVTKNGEVVSNEKISTSVYKPYPAQVKVGTKKAANQQAAAPAETAKPEEEE